MPEQFCTVNGDVELCYETFGDPSDPAVLLVMGLATQMVGWHEDFCEAFAERGYFVIRFDNRDIGRSQRMTGPVPTARQLVTLTLEQPAAELRPTGTWIVWNTRGLLGDRREPATFPVGEKSRRSQLTGVTAAHAARPNL